VVAVSREGDVWAIGSHRLICGDATDPAVVATLMQGDTAQLCFTSPPYGNQRDYTSGGIADWDVLMRGVFAHLPMAGDGQVLVNLGLIHRDNEVIPYWDGWLSWMRQQGGGASRGTSGIRGQACPATGRADWLPASSLFSTSIGSTRKPNKIVPCKHAGQESHLRADGSSTAMRGKDGEVGGWTHKGQPTQDTRIPDSVIRVMRHKGKIGQDIDHPAVFPVALPEFAIEAYTDSPVTSCSNPSAAVARRCWPRAHWSDLSQCRDCAGVRGRGHQALSAKPPRRAGHLDRHRPVFRARSPLSAPPPLMPR
jgi:hypothetical protein